MQDGNFQFPADQKQVERGTPLIQPSPHTKQTATVAQAVDDAVELVHRLQDGGVGSSQDVDGAKGITTISPASVAMDHLMMRVFQTSGGQPEAMISVLRQLLENAIGKLAAKSK
jgi:hypothetical protein